MSKSTVVFVASPRSDRYSNMAIRRLLDHGHEVFPLGFRSGKVHGLDIITDFPVLEDIHTITLYINAARQPEHYEYLISLAPQRIILNPGTENLEFQKLAEQNGIVTIVGCTLVMLSIGVF